MKGTLCIVVALCCFTTAALRAVADRGMISAHPGVSVYEPGQRAILAWNGREEVMVLATDVKASGNTKALEIMPFYSKPRIEKGSFESFRTLQGLFLSEITGGETGKLAQHGRTTIEIVSHEIIGPHDLTTVLVNFSCDENSSWNHVVTGAFASEFKDFVIPYLREIGMDNITFPDDLNEILYHYYLGSGYDGFYCVLDVIDISAEERSVTPLVYTFETDYLYYPLVISRLTGGETSIQLYVIMEGVPDVLAVRGWGAISQFQLGYVYDFAGNRLYSMIRPLSAEELKRVDTRIAALFSRSVEKVYVTVLTFEGSTEAFNDDIRTRRAMRLVTL